MPSAKQSANSGVDRIFKKNSSDKARKWKNSLKFGDIFQTRKVKRIQSELENALRQMFNWFYSSTRYVYDPKSPELQV